MTRIAGLSQRVVELTNALGGFDVDRILIPEGSLLHAQDETELFNMFGQVNEIKSNTFIFVEVV